MLPSIIIITALSHAIVAFRANTHVRYGLMGVRAAVSALILNSLVRMFIKSKKSVFGYIVAASALTLAALSIFGIIPLDIIFIIIAAAIAGIIYGYFINKRAQDDIP
jgi:chromate transport protein ChrA